MIGSEILPSRFPIFPLPGALLLPGGNLPLNIFEPRYLKMVRDAMQTDRVIGMIQTRPDEGEAVGLEGAPAIFTTGCAGRIVNFRETEDGRYLITLAGLARFDVMSELSVTTPYRQVRASFDRWHGDLDPTPPPESLRTSLEPAMRGFFVHNGIEVEWKAIKQAPLAGLITSLAMICPFGPSEKQALLEAETVERQGRLLVALMEMAVLEADAGAAAVRH